MIFLFFSFFVFSFFRNFFNFFFGCFNISFCVFGMFYAKIQNSSDRRRAKRNFAHIIAFAREMTDAADGVGWDDDESDGERAEREKRGYEKRGIVWPDGRMRPGYNAHVTVTGRLSSSKPINAQNFPKGLRSLITAQPGHVLVGADADQLELRIAASRWGCKLYLDAFAAGAGGDGGRCVGVGPTARDAHRERPATGEPHG
jgi:hypothetical protein